MAALLKQYDVGEKIDPLLQEYAIRCSQRFLVTHLPPIIHEARCPYCDVPLQSPRVGRYRKHLKPIPPQCPLCFHRPGANCSCAPCDKQRKELLAQRCGASSPAPAPPARLSISQALYLCSVVAHSASEDLDRIAPFASRPSRLAPTEELIRDIIGQLHASGLIGISPETDLRALVFDDSNRRIVTHEPERVQWMLLPTMNTQAKSAYLREVTQMVADGKWPDSWAQDTNALWRMITRHECIEYFRHIVRSAGYSLPTIGPRTHKIPSCSAFQRPSVSSKVRFGT